MARSIMEINVRTILKTESDLVDQNENLKFKSPKWKLSNLNVQNGNKPEIFFFFLAGGWGGGFKSVI